MENEINVRDFTRSKIYEKLNYIECPKNYKSEIPWIVQNQIAATNGIHYVDRIGKLKYYPTYELPVQNVQGNKLMLDIGAGWGRWLVSGSRKGYTPIGIDLRLEFCETQQVTLKHFNIKGYSVVADLESIPFLQNIFDLVWSFSVLQHTHISRMTNCLYGINSALKNNGLSFLEFPNKNGLRNRIINKQFFDKSNDDYNSWDVRYYTIAEYKKIFSEYMNDFCFQNHSFLGIGILKEDLKFVSLKNKIPIAVSLLLSTVCKMIPSLTNYSDSLYISSKKKSPSQDLDLSKFWNDHNDVFDNLNIVSLLKCPNSGVKLQIDETRKKVLALEAGYYYPVINNIPIIIKSEAHRI